MLFLYNVFFQIFIPFIILRLYWKSRRNSAYRQRWSERFAYYKNISYKHSIWIHAVSLGESIAAIPLINVLKQKYPDENIVVTTMTPTGSERLRQKFGDEIIQVYVPYDYSGAIKRFLQHFNPKLLIIMEKELWPNLLHYSAKRKIPILLANAQLSLRSFHRYQLIESFAKKILACITTVAAQSAVDGERFLALGLKPEQLLVTGNIKFDLTIADEVKEEAKKLMEFLDIAKNRLIWIAASTHEGEEKKVLIAMRKILKVMPEVLLILVPRHPERFGQVRDLCLDQGFKVVCYSQKQPCGAETQILIGDIIGKLLVFYSLAQAAFVGGSLVPVGGHNLLEPAALGVPILIGPNLTNCKEISTLFFADEAAILVQDEKELAEQVLQILQDKALHDLLAQKAVAILEQNKGVLEKLMFWVEKNYVV